MKIKMANASHPVVRVKRRITEEPLSEFCLSCKRPRLDGSNNPDEEQKEEISTLLRFAGTVEDQVSPYTFSSNIDILITFLQSTSIEQISRLTKDDAKRLTQKTRQPNIAQKSRAEQRQNLHENRYKVVNCHRAIESSGGECSSNPKEITIVDMEKQKAGTTTEIPVPSANSSTELESDRSTDERVDERYVYDLYVTDNGQQLPNDIDYTEAHMRLVFRLDYYI